MFRYVFDNQATWQQRKDLGKQSVQVPETGSGSNHIILAVPNSNPEPTANSNGHGIDVFNPDAVEAFIRATHEKYREHVGSIWVRLFPHFADELHTEVKQSSILVAAFTRIFQQDHGYDLTDHLPVLFFEYKK